MLTSLMTVASQLASNNILLTAPVKQAGSIVGPIAKLLGVISDVCFNVVYSITPVASLGITIILFTIVIKALLFPLSVKQQKSMMKTQAIQPKMKAIQDKYKDTKDPELQRKMSTEMNALYKDNKVNPFSGCLPLLIQMPILFALYYVIQQPEAYIKEISQVINNITVFVELNLDSIKTGLISIYQSLGNGNIPMDQIQFIKPILEAQQVYYVDLATVDGMATGIKALSSVDLQTFISTFFTQFEPFTQSQDSILMGLHNLLVIKDEIYNFLFLNLIKAPGFGFPGIIVPIVTWVTTYLQYKVSMSLQGQSASSNDAMASSQKTMMMIFPFMMAFMTINLPAGLGLYWNISNLIQIGQQLLLNKYFGVTKKEDDIIDAKIVDTKKGSKPKKRGV